MPPLTLASARAALKKSGVEVFDPKPYEIKIAQLAAEYGTTITPVSHFACAYRSRNLIETHWPLLTEAHVAVAAHEMGHILQPECTGVDPHYRDAKPGGAACVRCEGHAWGMAAALLRPLPWTEGMHRRLVAGLKSYRHSTRAWPQAQAELDRLTSELAFYRIKQLALEATITKPTKRNLITREERYMTNDNRHRHADIETADMGARRSLRNPLLVERLRMLRHSKCVKCAQPAKCLVNGDTYLCGACGVIHEQRRAVRRMSEFNG